MKTSYLTNRIKDEVLEEYISKLQKNNSLGTEMVSVKDSYHRILSQAVYAKRSSPHYNASAMDGIAVVASSTFHATSTTPIRLSKEEYEVVDTGDQVPQGKDAIIMIEDVTYEGDCVVLYAAASPWQHIRMIGEDMCYQDMIVPSFTRITPATMGALLAGGVREVEVIKKFTVGIIPTGDEIISSDKEPRDGEIVDFNSTIFKGMLYDYDCEVVTYDIVPDVLDQIQNVVKDALSSCDMVLINAGSSAGRDDYTTTVIKNLGEVVCHGIAIKPGKPTILGICENKPVIGIPGYPVSGVIVMREIVKEVIGSYYHNRMQEEEELDVSLSRSYTSSLKYEEYVRVQVSRQDERYVATPLQNGAGVITSFMKANAMLKIDQNKEGIEAGEKIKVSKLVSTQTIDDTISAVGSHDPLIDEISNELQLHSNYHMNSAHVGSMGAIMALKRGESHLGGIHLLDVEDGSYNQSYIERYFPSGDVVIIKGVKRAQGLLVAKGNPKNIKGIEDLINKDIRYVNRQKGSGTRILIDYLCNQKNIDTKSIYGYDHEEFSHSAVAAQINSGDADCGLGIQTAANMFDLDFVHIDYEDYDFIVKKEDLQSNQLQEVLKVLRSDELKAKIETMGGYLIEDIGHIIMRGE